MKTKNSKLKRIINLLILVLFLGITYPAYSQQDITNVNIENLSDEQIRQMIDEMNSRGLTMEQAIQLARAQGASQQQISQFSQRVQQMRTSGALNSAQGTQGTSNKTQQNRKGLDMLWDTQDTSYYMDMLIDSLKQMKEKKITEKNRKIFGFQLFNKDNLTFEPSVNIPVPPDYVLGIGDELVIQVWGASQQTYNLQIDNNGAVNIPNLGPVKVASLNFSEAKKIITGRLTAIYSGMTGANPNTYADVSVNNPRSIKVNVIGEAILPGTYTVPATASAFNVLYLSGGPNENGSFRNIHVIRNNRQLTGIDVYDYLIGGNTENNISLRDQDILFIPTYNKRVETTGAFKRDGIFELKEGETIRQLLQYCGGFSEDASRSRILLTRYADGQYELKDIDQARFDSIPLENGDLLRAEKVIDRYENRLTIEGAVFRPGTYALEKDMTLSRLIKKAGGLREDYFARRGLIIRLDDQLYPTTIPFDVTEVLNGADDPLLKREDQVIIRDIFSIGEKKTVKILGEVMEPGKYDFRKNMTLKDLIFLAGGMTEAASESYMEVARRNSPKEASVINSKMSSLYQFKIDRDLQLTEKDAAFLLQPFDQVYIRRAPSYEVQKTVKIGGEVQYPGEYSISDKNEWISDLIKRAGGLTPSAFAEGAKLKRELNEQLRDQLNVIKIMQQDLDSTIRVDTTARFAQLELRLDHILQKPGSTYDYFLKEGDDIFVPTKTEEIWVTGEVLNPIGLAWEQGRGLKYYINLSGGFSSDAKKNKAYVVYSNGTSQVTKSFILKNYPAVKPGSRIVVPAKPRRDKRDNTARWLAITSALSSLAVAIAAVLR